MMFKKVLNKIKNRRLLLVVILLFLVANVFIIYNTFSEKTTSSVWDGRIAKKFKNGSGSNSDPYVIDGGDELALLFKLINSSDYENYFNKFYKITNNIDLNGYDFSFATPFNKFSGHIDGNGYTIFNFTLNQYYLENKEASFSLFEYLDGSSIKNINFSDITFNINEESFIKKPNVKESVSVSDNYNKLLVNEESELLISDEENTTIIEENMDDVDEDEKENITVSENSENNSSENNNTESTNEDDNKENNEENEDTKDNSTDEIVIDDVEKISISLFKNVENSIIENISVNNIKINYTGECENIDSSLFILNDIDNNTISNVNINGNSDIETTTNLIYKYNNAKIDYIMYLSNSHSLVNDFDNESSNIFIYKIENGKLSFIENYPVKSIVEVMSNNSSLLWKFNNNQFKIQNNGKDKEETKVKNKRISKSAPSSHISGVENGIVYVNDYDNDYSYYMGLNYTYSSDGKIPTTNNKNIYGDSNLVYVQLNYHGRDIESVDTGYVSYSESQSDFVYYKVYNVVNGYVNIELIDNPYSRRPNDKVFMGWITDYVGAEISLDTDIYVRNLKVPASPNQSIVIDLYAVWGKGKIVNLGSSWSTAGNNIESSGFHAISGVRTIYEDVSPYYIRETISYGTDYPSGAVNSSGNPLTGYCRSYYSDCVYYVHPSSGTYTPGVTYYRLINGTMTQYTPQSTTGYSSDVPVGDPIAGYYRVVRIPYNSSIVGYYNSNGVLQTSGKCNTSGGCDYYQLIQYYDSNNDVEVVEQGEIYYYFTTRDTNIIVMNSSISNGWSFSKPFTLTSRNNNNNYSSSIWTVSSTTINCYADTRIENVKTSSGASLLNRNTAPSGNGGLYGNNYNLKIGRNVVASSPSSYATFSYVAGSNNSGTGSSSNLTKYSLIIESGVYNNLGVSTVSGSSGTYYIKAFATYGNDYDRVTEQNSATSSKLAVRYCASGSWSSNIRGESITDIPLTTTIKSGMFGINKYDYAAGVYAGGRGSGEHYSARRLFMEGGYVYNLIGGPLSRSAISTYNDTYMYIKGGVSDIVVGGAGQTQTYGNRIIQMTGGLVNYALFGGSNGVEGSNTYTSKVVGDSFVYLGGNAIIGDETLVSSNAVESKSNVEAGSLFGIGNGRNGYNAVGSVNNSNVIIDGEAIVRKNVYGGGNYGATGQDGTNKTYLTTIVIHGGDIKGSVYGGGNNNGAGTSSNTVNIDIEMDGGLVEGSIYGGSRNKGTIYGSTEIKVKGGSVYTDVYGGGEGGYTNSQNPGTFVSNNVSIEIGDSNNAPTINGSVYGGSAFGTVNATSTGAAANNKTVSVTVNNGRILSSVYGGAKGNATFTPYIKGNITVTINGGKIGSVYGGFDASGTPQGTDNVYITGGEITNVFGGGNQTSLTTTNITMSGGKVTNMYGGSNQSGAVTTTNISISAGELANVFGGNNEGGTCQTTNVTITGGEITNSVYGGGNLVGTTTTNVSISNTTGTILEVYGGGNQAGATTTNVTIGGTTRINDLFGGSNQLGNVNESNVIINNGAIQSLYGGNNAGGATTTSNVTVNNGSFITIFGGGNHATTTTTNVLIKDNHGLINSIYGGGNEAGATTTNVTIGDENSSSISIIKVYGGSNQSGSVTTSNVEVNFGNVSELYGGNNAGGTTSSSNITINDGQIMSLFGGGNEAVTNSAVVLINDGQFGNIYGGGNDAGITTNTSLTILGGTTTQNVYGGGNNGTVGGNTSVLIHNANVNGSAYAGGNGATATVTGNTLITVSGTSVIGTQACTLLSTCSVFGGGNAAVTGSEIIDDSTATVNIIGATIYGNVYGGANTSRVYGATSVNIGDDVIPGQNIVKGDIYIKGTVFGGGEANASGSDEYDWTFISVTKGIDVNINGNGYNNFDIDGSIFGSGNASTAAGRSEVKIYNYGTFANPKKNISIQRTNLVVLNNSAIILVGATDRENEYSDVLFTLSRINELNLVNNSTLFLETGANLLEDFKSLNSNGTPATVVIDKENETVTKSTDNRVYMYADKKLNIAHNQSITDYGEVTGMSFFGMYKYYANNTINTGIYNDYAYGTTLDWGGVFDNVSSYVLGLHKTNHDITADGFYTNYIDEETSKNMMDYIEPTPPASALYMWTIGEGVIEYEVDLSASKYSTLGTYELTLIDFTDPNTTFEILGFDYSELNSGVELVAKNEIKRIADTETEADNKMGLAMETSNTGWLTNGRTSFMTDAPHIVGTTSYVGGNNLVAPSLLLYLYHSKNISSAGDMGTVRIQLMSIRQIDALTKETKRLNISINLSRVLFDTVNYEGSMTAGRKYDLFTSTATNITSSSAISAYFSLFSSGDDIYKTGYHRSLLSTFALPVDTKITMIDFGGTTPEYYYHVINATDYSNSLTELAQEGEVHYDLSLFEVMGAFNSGVYYNDVLKNAIYRNDDLEYNDEEFIFIIDFGDTTISTDQLNNMLLLEIRNAQNESIYSVLSIQHSDMTYNIYTNKDAVIDMDGTIDKNTIYNGDTIIADMLINYTQSLIGSTTIYDTHYFDSKLGLKITILDSDGNILSGSTLLGLYYEIDGVRYYPNLDGTTRIKIADKVDSAEKWVIINTGTSKIATGNYKIRFESFGSPDGIYFGLNSSDTKDFNIRIINEIYGLDVSIPTEEMIIDSVSGKNELNSKSIHFTIDYNSGLSNPNIRFKLYRRNYNQIDDTTYSLVDASDYFVDRLIDTLNSNEYLITDRPGASINLTYEFQEGLITGTYKMQFELYDDDALIGTVEKYFIIK